MKQKIIFIITGYVFILLIGLISCDKCGPFPDKLKVIGLDWHIYNAVYSEDADEKLILSEIINDTVDYNSYSIFITPITETYFTTVQRNKPFEWTNTAYACSPITPTTDDRIDSILIITNIDFDATHPAKSDLSQLFDIVVYDQANKIYYKKFTMNDYISTKPYVPNEMTLILNAPPSLTMSFDFTVKYYQDGIDNDYFEFKTNNIVIKK